MPKKTRKAKERAAARRRMSSGYELPPVTEPVGERPVARPIPSAMPSPRVSSFTRGPAPVTFDYSYVYGDLRRIGLLAAFFFAVMLVLWFVLPSLHIGF